MASISEQIIQAGLEGAGEVADLSQSVAQGVGLAQQVERTRLMREQIEQQKKNVRNQKLENMNSDILKGRKLGGKAKAGYTKFLKNKAKVLKIDDIYSEEAIDLVLADPENIDRFDVIVNQVRAGELSMEKAQMMLKDEGLFYEVDPAERQRLAAADVKRIESEEKMQRAETMAGFAMGRQVQKQESTAKVAAASGAGKAFAAYNEDGGDAGYEKTINAYKDAIGALKENRVKLGTMLKKVPFGSEENVLARTDPEAKALIDQIRSSINIKAQSGDPNPAAWQIQQILDRAIDPRLDNKANIEKLEAEIQRMEKDRKEKQKFFRDQGLIDSTEAASDKKVSAKQAKRPAPDSYDLGGKKLTRPQMTELIKARPELLGEISKMLGINQDELLRELGLEE